jgi:hypothetical protein
MSIKKKLDKEAIHFMIVNNVNKSNVGYIHFGNIKNNNMFNMKYKKQTNIYDLIPLLNSLLLDKIQCLSVYKIKKHYYENKIHIIQKIINDTKEIRYTLINKLNNFYLYNNDTDKCITFNTIQEINNLYFPSIKEYNHIENYILLEWLIIHDITIQLKKYSNYITISIKIKLIETNTCPSKKIEIIYELCNILEIIMNYFE